MIPSSCPDLRKSKCKKRKTKTPNKQNPWKLVRKENINKKLIERKETCITTAPQQKEKALSPIVHLKEARVEDGKD